MPNTSIPVRRSSPRLPFTPHSFSPFYHVVLFRFPHLDFSLHFPCPQSYLPIPTLSFWVSTHSCSLLTVCPSPIRSIAFPHLSLLPRLPFRTLFSTPTFHCFVLLTFLPTHRFSSDSHTYLALSLYPFSPSNIHEHPFFPLSYICVPSSSTLPILWAPHGSCHLILSQHHNNTSPISLPIFDMNDRYSFLTLHSSAIFFSFLFYLLSFCPPPLVPTFPLPYDIPSPPPLANRSLPPVLSGARGRYLLCGRHLERSLNH